MARETLTGPEGLRLELDSAQIFPDDPGNGTPAMVYVGDNSATYWCAVDTGELDCGTHRLTWAQQNWLDTTGAAAVETFMEKYS